MKDCSIKINIDGSNYGVASEIDDDVIQDDEFKFNMLSKMVKAVLEVALGNEYNLVVKIGVIGQDGRPI